MARRSYRLALLLAGGWLFLFLGGLVIQPTAAQAPPITDQAALEVKQTVGENVGICASTVTIAVTVGKNVYYCVTVRNSGTVPLSHYTLSSSNFPKDTASFTQTLDPGQEIQLTKNVLDSLKANGAILSQLASGTTGTVITNTITVTATNSAGATATGQAAARFVIGSVGLKVTKTVGLTDACPTTKGIAVEANTMVKYCVTMQNTGTLPLINHRVSDPLVRVDVTFPLTNFTPGATLVITDGALQRYDKSQHLNLAITGDVTNTLLVTSTTAEGVVVSGSAQAVAVVGRMSSVLTYTVGLEDGCAASTILPFISGRTLYYCLKLTNNGTVPLESHTVRWVQQSSTTPLVNTTITQTVQPGQTLLITRSRIAQLAQANVTTNQTNDFAVTSANHRGMVTAASAKGTVTVGPQTLLVTKYAPTDRNSCVSSLPLNIVAGQEFYYCVVMTNTGQVPLVRHTFSEGAPLNISGAFTYTLAPNQKITLTNQFLTNNLGLPALFGPFKATTSFLGTLTINSFSAANVQVSQSAAVQVNVSVPTTLPTAVPTFTPSITPTPSPAPTLPPTPTPSPVVLSFQPTPTQPFSVNAITTPTPGVLPGAAPPAVDQFGQPIPPTVDPFAQPNSPLLEQPTVDIASTVFALTLEAAATQTALAFLAPPVTDTPIAPPVVQSPLETPSPAVTVVVTPTATPLVLVLTPLPTPVVTTGYLDVVSQVFQVSTVTLGWLWFAIGSLIFFATAGMFAGLSWRQRRQGVYEMAERATPADEGLRLEPTATQSFSLQSPAVSSSGTQSPDDEDYWPASLR